MTFLFLTTSIYALRVIREVMLHTLSRVSTTVDGDYIYRTIGLSRNALILIMKVQPENCLIGEYAGVVKKNDTPQTDVGKQIYLDIDGAMSYASVWCNGNYVSG